MNKDGLTITKKMTGFLSRLFQHEVDHLNGKLMFERKLMEAYIDKDSKLTPELFHQLNEECNK